MTIFRIRFALIATLLFCSFALQVSAQTTADTTAAPSSILSLSDAIKATLAKNPQLSSFQFRKQALEGELQTAALRPAFQIGATVENAAGTGEYSGSKSAEVTLTLSSIIEFGDKQEARMGVVNERQQGLDLQQRIIELDLLSEVARRFIDVATAQKMLGLRQSTHSLATETTASIKQRVNSGNTPDAELARAQANQSRTAIELYQAELKFDAARIKLSGMWGSTNPTFTSVNADLFSTGDILPLYELLAQLSDRPDILLFANEARMKDAEVRLALSQSKADVEWNAGIRRLQASDDTAVVLGISVPLFANNRAAGELTTAKANRLGVDIEREVAFRQMRTQLVILYQEHKASLFELKSLRNDVIPQLKIALRETKAAFDKGRYGYLELSTAQRELLEAESALIDAAANVHLLRSEIERLSGTSTAQNSEVKP
ncbi:TolC family protein [Shewanella avicenniae]|uniref:TolC family protein n=1 Tax=Shewanella avicenniae TaxID=2814294 RepID=A0ABX7QS94_9GAMM|nr:TolC family protein [Shewanella avicenniae]QSX33795.1 TolC family protein [Shewanella avicenniae]